MSNKINNKETLEYLEKAQFVFMVNFEDNTQNISVGEGVPIAELLSIPFRASIHLNKLLEESLNEGQTGEVVAEDKETEN